MFVNSGRRFAPQTAILAAILALAMTVAAHAQRETYSFNIPAQDLGAALREYAKASGQQVSFDGALVRGKTSAALIGSYTANAAIEMLLNGTGLVSHRGPLGVILLESAARPSDPPRSDKRPVMLEEVIVTATRREVSLQKVPEAITAITGEQIDNLNAQTFQDYFRTVPGLMMNSLGGGANRFDFSLRGISDFSQLSVVQNATVGQYYDDIPVTAVGQQIDARLVDIDRIEVLRGPQGTYFGEDSLGGTIRVITKKPLLNKFSASVEGRASNTTHGSVNDSESIMANIPLVTDMLAVRANYFNADDSGFINGVTAACSATNPTCNIASVDSKRVNPDRANGGRGMVLFQPSERISLLAEVVHSLSVADDATLYEPKVGDLLIIQHDCNAGGGFGPGPGGPGPGGPGGCSAGSGAQPGDLPNAVTKDQDNLYNLTGNFGLGFADLVSSSSWGYRDVNLSTPQPGPGGTVVPNGSINTFDTFAQELRLASSKDWSTRWDYLFGAYYSREHTVFSTYGQQGPGPGGVNSSLGQLVKTRAAFGELGYKFTDHWNARAGVRQQTIDLTNTLGGSTSNHPTTGRVVVNYSFSGDAMTYASISRGFRKGGINNTLNSFTPGVPIPGINRAFSPDTTMNYELGWKLSFPTCKATLDGALYHIDWNNIQVASVANVPGAPPPANITSFYHNVGAAKVDGLELEGGMEVAPGLQAQATLALMNPRIAKDQPLTPDNPDALPPSYARAYCQRGCPARSGDEIPFVSKVSGSVGLNYHHGLPWGGFKGFATVNEQYTGTRNTDFAPTWRGPSQSDVTVNVPCQPGQQPPCVLTVPRTHTGQTNDAFRTIRASVLTNLQVGLENGKWRVAAFLDNVFDRRNPTIVTPSSPGADANGDQWVVDRPRTVGLFVRRTLE